MFRICSSRTIKTNVITILPYYKATRCFSSSTNSSSSSQSLVLSHTDADGICTITFNRPEQANAMTIAMGNEFVSTIDKIKQDQRVKVVVLTGAGQAFSAGGDLEFLLERPKHTPAENAEEMRRFYDRFLQIRTLPVPTIAAINGAAVGAGLCVSLACDLRLCSPKAKLGLTFVNLGIHPGMGASYLLPLLIGHQLASTLLLTGEIVNAQKALEMKLVASVEEKVMDASLALAKNIAHQSPVAIRTLTKTLRMWQEDKPSLERALWREADAQAQCYASQEYLQRVNAIRDKVKADKK